MPEITATWVADGATIRETQDLLLRAIMEAERTIRVATAMRARALAHLGTLADQEAAHTEHVDDASLASSRAVEAAHRSSIAEVATMLRIPEGTARRWWEDARTAHEDHPELWRALLRGELSERHVTVALDELTTLPVAARARLEQEILEKAPTVTAASLQAFARRRRELLHPESVEVRHRRARAGRHLVLAPPRDGMSTLTAHLPAAAAHAIYNRCTDAAMAVRSAEDPRTLTQLRADALMAYALTDRALLVPQRTRDTSAPGSDSSTPEACSSTPEAGSSTPEACSSTPAAAPQGTNRTRMLEAAYVESLGDDDAHADSSACDVDIYGIVPTVAVLVPVDWLADAAPPDRDGEAPHGRGTPGRSAQADPIPRSAHQHGELVGAGPIDRETARALAAASPSLRRILTDPHTGVLLDMSRSTYRVPAHLRAFAQLRDETCRFPGCRRRAEACDLDHVEAWDEGGPTSASNLAHLCRMHHRLKHAGAWSVQVADDERTTALRDAIRSNGVRDLPVHRRLRPSTLVWTSPTGRTARTHAALDPALSPAQDKVRSGSRDDDDSSSTEDRPGEGVPHENVTDGSVPHENVTDGDMPHENVPYGDMPHENVPYGDVPDGNTIEGNTTDGNTTERNTPSDSRPSDASPCDVIPDDARLSGTSPRIDGADDNIPF